MGENGNHPGVRAVEARRRVPGTRPILILAGLFVAATFLAWYFTWFGRELSDADISKYLADEQNPRHVQHALLQIQQRIERGDTTSKSWYPQLIALSGSSETEFRLSVAWLMGSDTSAPQFHETLLKLLKDPEPIVRRNAALGLVRFNDPAGHDELLSVLRPFVVKAPANGVVASSLQEGNTVSRTTLLARINRPDGIVEGVRSPLPGRIQKLFKANGAQVSAGDELLSLNSDESSVWEALRGLALIGKKEALPVVRSYADSTEVSGRIRDQAKLTATAIETRVKRI